jgi:hypothetical protein
MRTRVLHDGVGVLSQIQHESGCRIHIERKHHEVRLFGLPEQRSLANKLLDNFALEVKETNVEISTSVMIEDSLEPIASSCGVTLLMKNGRVMVLGLIENVDKAVQEIEQCKRPKSRFENDVETRQAPRPYGSQQEAPPRGAVATKQYVLDNVERNIPAMKQSTHTQQNPTAHGIHGSTQEGRTSACPTCGCGNFCTSCGAQIGAWQYAPFVIQQQCFPASPGNFPANAMLIPYVMAPQSTLMDGGSYGEFA